jgi:uncharacterized membrane protein
LAIGLGAGAAAGVTLAVLRGLAIVRERELVSLATLIPLAAAEILLLAVAARRPRWAAWLLGGLAALLAFRDLPGILLGWSAYLLPGQPALTTATLARSAGLAGGLLFAGLTAWAVCRAARRLDRRFAAAAVMIAAAAGLFAHLTGLVQILQGRRLVTLPRPGFRVLVWAINHQGLVLAVLAVVGASAAVLAWWGARRADVKPGARPAETRLAQAAARRGRRLGYLALGAVVATWGTVTLLAWWANRTPELSEPEPFTIVAGEAVIPLDDLADGHLHRFAYTAADGTEVRFIVIQKNGVAYGVGFDACEICGATGYLERAGQIVCRLCDVVMNIATIGYRGGCNPIPLDHSVEAGAIHIDLADLEAGAELFA